jgi:outer membrane cobalamin receptor
LDFHPWSQVRANVTLLSIGDRIGSDGSDMDDYERLDVALHYEFLESLSAYLRVENLTDEDYEEVNGFTAPGSVAAVGLSFEI